MNLPNNIPQHTQRANSYHSPDCVDPQNYPKCKAYVESVKVDLSTFSRLLADFNKQFGGGHE